MSSSIVALNKGLNEKINLKENIVTKDMIIRGVLLVFLSLVSYTSKFNIGAVFILPLVSLVLKWNRKEGIILSSLTIVMTLIINFQGSLAIILGILLLLVFLSDKQLVTNPYLLMVISMVTYGINVFLEHIAFNPFLLILIALVTYIFCFIYNKVLEIKTYHVTKHRSLFSEEIITLLAIVINVLIGMFFISFSMGSFIFNIGFMTTCLAIIILGVVSSPLYIIGFSLSMYLILTYGTISVSGSEILPFLGLIATLVQKGYTNIKTFLYLLLAPALFYLKVLSGDIQFVLMNLFIPISISYFIVDVIYKTYGDALVLKNSENNLINMYMDDFKEETSRRLLNFAEIFETFAYKSTESNQELQKIDDSINEIFEKHCSQCLKKELCLNTNYIKTYNYLSQILKTGNDILDVSKQRFIELFGMYCLNAYEVINTSIYLNKEYMLNQTKTESLIYQSQLQGLAQIIQGYALEMSSQRLNDHEKVLTLKDTLNKLGINIHYLKLNNIKKHHVHIELGVNRNQPIEDAELKEVFELIFDETMDVFQLSNKKENVKYRIRSKRTFDIDFGTSYIGKDGNRISGDNFIKCDNGQGNTVIALCDGMGSGYSAHVESKTTLELLSKMLETGADDQMSVSVINTLVALKEYKERFSTLHYATINQGDKTINFYKIGSAPSFIIRGNRVIRIDNDNLPIGFSSEIEAITIELELDDIIVMVSDGIVDRMNNIEKFESILSKLAKNNPIQIAHDIIQVSIKENGGKILDDMTAIVLKIDKVQEKGRKGKERDC